MNASNEVKSRLQAALQAVDLLEEVARRQPQYLFDHNLDLARIRGLAKELRDVYFVRMFACFESSLRHYWRASVRDTKPLTEQLVSSVAGRLAVPQDTLDEVNDIRKFRNSLIHEEAKVTRRFTVEEASKHLNAYLARLPLEW